MTDAKLVTQLIASGITSADHHTQIKKGIEEATGEKPSKDDYQRIKGLLEQAEQEPQKEPASPEELRAKAEAIVEERAKDPTMTGWELVQEVVEATSTGKPARVVIECQTQDEDVCVGTREIATQDVFQVSRCVPCQKRAGNRRRAEKRKAKTKS